MQCTVLTNTEKYDIIIYSLLNKNVIEREDKFLMSKKVYARVKSVKGPIKQNSTFEPTPAKNLVEDDILKRYMNDYDRDRIEAECIKKEYDALGIPCSIVQGPGGYECVVSKESYSFDGVLLQKEDVIYFKKNFHKCFDSMEYGIDDQNHLKYYEEPFILEEIKKDGNNYIVSAKRMSGNEPSCDFIVHDCSVIKTSCWSKRDEASFFIKKELPWCLLAFALIIMLVSVLFVAVSFISRCDTISVRNALQWFFEIMLGPGELANMYADSFSEIISFGLKMIFPSIFLIAIAKLLFKRLKL